MLLELKLKAKKILDEAEKEAAVEAVKVQPCRKISKRVFKKVDTTESRSDEWASLNTDYFKSDPVPEDENISNQENEIEENSKFTSDDKKKDNSNDKDILVYPEKIVIPVRKQNSLKSKVKPLSPLKLPGTNTTTSIQQNFNEGILLFCISCMMHSHGPQTFYYYFTLSNPNPRVF